MFARRVKHAPASVRRAAQAVVSQLESRILFVEVAGTLLVDIDATTLPEGPAQTIVNNGTTNKVFEAVGGGTTVPVIDTPVTTSPVGTRGIVLDGNDFLQHFDPDTGALIPADAGLVGANPTRSIEVWVWNQFVSDEETMVAWGRRGGPEGTNMSFNYGSNGAYGAIGHWGAPDIGWGTNPVRAQWHHLVYTFDGPTSTTRVYVDGVQTNTEVLAANAINTHGGTPITLGAQMEGTTGQVVTAGLRGSLTLGKVRVHDGVLTPEQIALNFAEEDASFVEPEIEPPPPPPPAVLVVDLNARDRTEGPTGTIPNSGPLGGFFAPTGGGETVPSIDQPLPESTTGTRGIRLDGGDYLQMVDADGNLLAAPAELVGVDPKVSMDAWVWNPSVPTEETILAWGRRGNDGRNMSFNYGNSAAFGAVGHWGGSDIGWGTGQVPSAQQWHHVVHTFDGLTTRIYVDGVQTNTEELAPGTLNIVPGIPITIGAQIEPNGTTVTPALRGDLTIGRARVYTGVLTPEQIAATYAAEKPTYVEPDKSPAELVTPPIHRYSFTNTAGAAEADTVVEDLIGEADANVRGTGATFTGTRISLPGGSSATAPYVDLPNYLLFNQSSDVGGTGLITLEGWTRHTGNHNWGRFFDFGGSTAGELLAPGGTGNGSQYWMLSQAGTNVNAHRTELIQGTNLPGNRTQDVGVATFNQDLHWAASWNETSGEVTVYEQGVEVAKFNTPLRFSSINDLNNWLGRSNFTGDGNFQGEFDEFRIYDRVLSAAEIRGNFLRGPDSLEGGAATVTEIYVRGSTWAGNDNNAGNTTFKEYLEAKGLGDDVFGYRLYANGAPTAGPANNPDQVLPWINVDEIVVRYNAPPTGGGVPTPGTLTVNGQRNGAYTITSVTPVEGDPTAFVLRLGKVLGGGDPVANTTPTTTENGDRITLAVPGGGSGGTNFSLRMNVLQGDVDHLNETTHNVLARDYAEVKKRFFKNTNTAPSNPDTDYSAFHDVDGNGQILATDYARVKSRFFQNLPAAAGAGGAPLEGSSITSQLFASEQILG